jgi:hypothetical protein
MMRRAMAPPTPAQQQWRARFEVLFRLMQPGLDLMLLAGDRLSRVVDRSDDEPVPAIRFPDDVRPLAPGPPPDLRR